MQLTDSEYVVGSMPIMTRVGTGAVHRVARQLGYGTESVRSRVRQADIDEGRAPGVSTSEASRVAKLEQENRQLRRANETVKHGARFFGAELCSTRRLADRGG